VIIDPARTGFIGGLGPFKLRSELSLGGKIVFDRKGLIIIGVVIETGRFDLPGIVCYLYLAEPRVVPPLRQIVSLLPVEF